jgi:hypothetical protein
MKKFTKIKGLSDSRRMPRLNKIRLGAKVLNSAGKEYPVELPFFLLPNEVAAIHGGKIEDPVKRAKALGLNNKAALKFIGENAGKLAEELPVMIPVEDENMSFPQSYKLYGGSIGLKCSGDGEEAQERQGITNNWTPRSCPCNQLKSDDNPKGGCTIVANLQIILPDVSMGGVYQIDIGSINSIIDINSGIDYTKSVYEKATGEKRVAMVPLLLRRAPTETHHGGKKQIHFTCRLSPVGTIQTFAKLANDSRYILTHAEALMLPEPELSDPALRPVDMVYEQPEHVKKIIAELDDLKKKGKLKKGEIDAIRTAKERGEDEVIENIYTAVMDRIPTGSTQKDTAAKLKGKKKASDKAKTDKQKQKENAVDVEPDSDQDHSGDPGASEPPAGGRF